MNECSRQDSSSSLNARSQGSPKSVIISNQVRSPAFRRLECLIPIKFAVPPSGGLNASFQSSPQSPSGGCGLSSAGNACPKWHSALCLSGDSRRHGIFCKEPLHFCTPDSEQGPESGSFTRSGQSSPIHTPGNLLQHIPALSQGGPLPAFDQSDLQRIIRGEREPVPAG